MKLALNCARVAGTEILDRAAAKGLARVLDLPGPAARCWAAAAAFAKADASARVVARVGYFAAQDGRIAHSLAADRVAAENPEWDGHAPDPGTSKAPYRIYNIGNHQPVELMEMIGTLEACLGKTAEKNMMPMQPGDVPATYADVSDLTKDVGFKPSTCLLYTSPSPRDQRGSRMPSSA